MRAALLVLACAACGRVGFERSSDGDGGTGTPNDGARDDSPDSTITSDLQLWLEMDTLPNPSVADSSAYQLALTCDVGSCPTLTAGMRGNAFLFDGNDMIRVPYAPRLARPVGTIAAWARCDSFPTGLYRFAFGKPYDINDNKNSWEIFVPPSQDWIAGGDSTGVNQHRGAVADLSVWAHVAMTWDETSSTVYVDGAFVATGAFAILYDNQDVVVGGDLDFGAPANHWIGALDDVRLYNRMLSAQEIMALAAP